ncbi:hypothetical protein Tco_0954586 [Tanacetum coccineum]|uniref:Uncharacterized protein n=1 Tax=Tanacetum coccineum TaxID=301880 RepID=A0ABQ5E4U7_9ASTR
MVERDDEIKVLGKINLELQSGNHKLIEKLSHEKVSQEEALEQFKSMVERDDEIKVLGDINVELESRTNKLRKKLSQEKDSEEEALEEFNLTLDNILEKLSQEKDSPETFMDWPEKDSPGTEVDWKDDPLHDTEYFFVGSLKWLNDQAKALSNQEVADECLDDEHVEEKGPNKRIRVTHEEMVKDEKPKKGL